MRSKTAIMSKRSNRHGGVADVTGAFTLVELLTVITIIAILAGILLPTFGAIREQGLMTKCQTNLGAIGRGLMSYANAPGNNDCLPPGDYGATESWATILTSRSYIQAPMAGNAGEIKPGSSHLQCPSGELRVGGGGPTSPEDTMGGCAMAQAGRRPEGAQFYVHNWYAVNGVTGADANYAMNRNTVVRLSPMRAKASETVAVFDGWWMHDMNRNNINARHMRQTKTNLLFLDGSTGVLEWADRLDDASFPDLVRSTVTPRFRTK